LFCDECFDYVNRVLCRLLDSEVSMAIIGTLLGRVLIYLENEIYIFDMKGLI